MQQIIGVGQRLLGSFESLALQAAHFDASLARLKKSIENTGVAMTDSMTKKLNENLDAMEAASGFNNDELIPAYANLVAITGSYQEATDRMALAQDFARGAGIELSTASRLLGKVTDETTTVLARYGIRVEKGATATELLAKVQQKFGGQSKAFMSSVLGQWTALQNRIDDSKRAMSERLQPAFLKFIELANKALDITGGMFKGWEKPIGNAVGLLGNFAGALGEIFDVASADSSLIDLAPPIDEFKTKGKSKESQDQSEAIKKASQGGELSKVIGPDAAKGFMSNVAKLREAIRALWTFIVRAFEEGRKRLQPVLDGIGVQLANLRKEFEKLPKPMQDFVSNSAMAGVVGEAAWLTVGKSVLGVTANLASLASTAVKAGVAGVISFGLWAAVIALVVLGIYLIVTHWDDLVEMVKIGAASLVLIFAAIGEAIVNSLLSPLNDVIDLINGIIGLKNMLTGSHDALLGKVSVDFTSGARGALQQTILDAVAAGEARKKAGGTVGFDPETQGFISKAGGVVSDAMSGGTKIASLVQNITINGNADKDTVKAFAGATSDGLTQLAQVQVRRVGNRPQ